MNKLIFALFLIAPTAFAAIADIPAFQQVNPQLYRGGRPTLEQVSELHSSAGIKTVLNLQGGDLDNFGMVNLVSWWEPGELPENIAAERSAAENSGLVFKNFPLNSLAPVTDEEDLQIDQILTVMSDPLAQPVFVHCEHGIDRTGLIIALYRVKTEGWTVEQAYDEWIAGGHTMTARLFTGDLDIYYFRKAQSFVKSDLSDGRQ